MFPEGKQLPHLHTLILESVFLGDDESFMTAADLNRVFAACPALECFSITHALQPGEECGLLNLPARCTHLSIGGMALADSSVSVVTQLTQLRSLFWQRSPRLADIGLEQLTALRALTRLYLQQDLGLSEEVVQAAMTLHDVDSDYECLKIQQVSKMVPGTVHDRFAAQCAAQEASVTGLLPQHRVQVLAVGLSGVCQHFATDSWGCRAGSSTPCSMLRA